MILEPNKRDYPMAAHEKIEHIKIDGEDLTFITKEYLDTMASYEGEIVGKIKGRPKYYAISEGGRIVYFHPLPDKPYKAEALLLVQREI